MKIFLRAHLVFLKLYFSKLKQTSNGFESNLFKFLSLKFSQKKNMIIILRFKKLNFFKIKN